MPDAVSNAAWAVLTCMACAGILQPAYGARILAIETVAGKSHWNFMSSVLETLTDNGHRVTVLTPFPDGDRENYTEIDTSKVLAAKVGMRFNGLMSMFKSTNSFISVCVKIFRNICDTFYDDRDGLLAETFANGLRDHFDAIVIEPGPLQCLTYVASKSDLPLIYSMPTVNIISKELETIGSFSSPATTSSLISNYRVPKTFAHRFSETVYLIVESFLYAYHEYKFKVTDPKPYDSYVTVPPSLVFVNSHFLTDASHPMPPNMISVGGIHLKPVKEIPKDILQFIEESQHGVILFTFGSTVLINSLPKDILKAFKEVLAQLPQRVLLKYEGEMEDKPKNVMTRKWFPQRDILMHPKVKLFISHGGISGVYEALDAGVPVLGFPLFGDQPRNIDNLVYWGMAISMNIFSVTRDSFLNNVLEIVNNEKYMKNAKIALNIFKDHSMTPKESVVYWTEYVIRHKGAHHLKSQGLNLTWYQYFLLDVFVVMLVLILIILFIIYKIFKILFRFIKTFGKNIKKKSE